MSWRTCGNPDCVHGREVFSTDGKAWSRRCYSCEGTGKGWGSSALAVGIVVLVAIAFARICNGGSFR